MSTKSKYTAYHYEEIEMIHHFGKPGFSKFMLQLGQSAGFILPDLGMWRRLAKVVFKKGNVQEALLYGKVCRKALEGSDTLISVLVFAEVGRIFLRNQELSQKVKLASPETYNFFSTSAKTVDEWKKKDDKGELKKLINSKGGVLASMILPAFNDTLGIVTEKSLEPSRKMEYSFFENIYFIPLINEMIY